MAISYCFIWQLSRNFYSIVLISLFRFSVIARKSSMTGSIQIFEKSNFTPKLSVLVFLKVKLPNMTDWHILEKLKFPEYSDLHDSSYRSNNVANLLKSLIFQVSKCEYKFAFSCILVKCHILPGQPGQCTFGFS